MIVDVKFTVGRRPGKPGRSERGQKFGPLSWPAKLKTDGHFGGQTGGQKFGPLTFFGRPTSRSKFLAAGLAAKVAVRLYNRPSRRSCSRFKKFLAASMAVCTVPNTPVDHYV
ncbi:hypothetical protein BpHYR1_001213 [Brachionus plicatilis]|uniref:Uncharacterized protein n=1 Tax=Brachionus plicatilis TaxID=10195 RepID=A0A3M7T1L6_BRAPC|nr:hypothetical protein BpHYR1_001213 [Brachionus plicatilis]